MSDRIYLDNAATSFPKPESVYQNIDRYLRTNGAPHGRGDYPQADEVNRIVDQARARVAELINAEHRKEIAFTYSGTDSLCTAIFGLLNALDATELAHVVTTSAEHNSILRPLKHLESQGKIELTVVPCDQSGYTSSKKIIAATKPTTRLVAMTHVGNVTGSIQPVSSVGAHCRNRRIPFLVDAAQSLGSIPVDVQKIQCDLLAAPGHKGLFSPTGVGILYCRTDIAGQVQPLRFGGTGSLNSTDEQPTEAPDKFESGNMNVAGIAGILAGVDYLNSKEGKKRLANMTKLKQQLLDGLLDIESVQIHGSLDLDDRIGVFSLNIDGLPCTEAASILDSNWSIQTRAGFHCAPLVHRSIETETLGGSLRISLGLFNTAEQIERLLIAVREISDSF